MAVVTIIVKAAVVVAEEALLLWLIKTYQYKSHFTIDSN